ncbi:hypothetical protein C8Q78DRAFT_970338 [Trametes maxima]|nr:hypothetical protein C8Q78DRAFT_970338 [Trametes maxima]
MSDITTDAPLDPGTASAPSNDPNFPDSNATTDPNATTQDPNLGTENGPNVGTTDDVPVVTGPDQSGSTSGVTDGTDPNAVNNTPLPSNPTQTVQPTPPFTSSAPDSVVNGQQPSANPNSLGDTGADASRSLGGKSDSQTETIIIASSVSGGVALILALVVILFVYRRRNTRRRSANFANDTPILARQGSDATWIGQPAAKGYDDPKLEAGERNSNATLESSVTTLADFTMVRATSRPFTTPTHTPRPSADKIKTQVTPMVPSDPFEKPRLSLADQPRASLYQASQAPPPQRKRKNGAPTIRVNSNSSFNGSVEIEQGYAMALQSPGSPMLPLVTPLSPPPGWRGVQNLEYMRAPTRRDSMVSLSRQSSKASSRNSRILDQSEPAQGAKLSSKPSVTSIFGRKRRSRADSIDPFRKSSASMMGRRKSRAESVASARQNASGGAGTRRKSRAESIAPPTTPGGRRKSRAGSIAPPMASRRRSQASIASAQSIIFSAPVESMPTVIGLPRTPRTPGVGLPRTPRTPTAARPSRGAEPRTPVASREPRTPVTARTPRTPATSREPQTPRTSGGHPRTPSAAVPRTPTSLDDAIQWGAMPLPPVPTSTPRPLPTVPTPERAELRLSQLSRALSEVSSKDSHLSR